MPSPNIMEALLRMQQLPGTVMPTDYNVGQPDPMQIDPAELQRDALDARTKSQLAQALIGQGYIPNSGKAGILSQVFSTLVGAKMQRGADEKMSDVLGKNFKLKQQQDERAYQQQLAEEDRKFKRELELARQKGQIDKENRVPGFEEQLFGQIPPELRGKAALGKFGLLPKEREPRAPTSFEQEMAALRAVGATPEQIRAKLLGQNTRAPAVPSGYRETPTGLEFIPGGPADPAMKISPATVQNVKTKLQAIENIEQQLVKAKESFTKTKGAAAGPFGQGLLPTEPGNQFDKTIATLAPSIRQLTRTPGEGAMSDYESRLAQAMLPSRTDYESTTEKQLADLEAMLSALKTGYQGMLPGQGGAESPAGKRLKFNPETGELE